MLGYLNKRWADMLRVVGHIRDHEATMSSAATALRGEQLVKKRTDKGVCLSPQLRAAAAICVVIRELVEDSRQFSENILYWEDWPG